jgi:hypothetical protein
MNSKNSRLVEMSSLRNFFGSLFSLVGLKLGSLLAVLAALVSSGGFPSSVGDVAFFAASAAFPAIGFAGSVSRVNSAYVIFSAAASLGAFALALLLVGAGSCSGGDGLGCEVLILALAPVYAFLEVFSFVKLRRAK